MYILICQTFLLCTKVMFTQLMALTGSNGSHTFYTGTHHNIMEKDCKDAMDPAF